MQFYDPKKIEKKWQKKWKTAKVYRAKDSGKKKDYLLVEFPYPSGDGLHTGHVRSYTAMDIVARKHRMEGKNVLYPIGWDAFGLPTENYAIKTGAHPAKVTKQNTDTFRRQLKSLGLSFDWSREVNTTDPEYYKWTQWIFLQLYKHDLAYKAKTEINWCLSCKIGLANEEVVDGKCERCGSPTEKREKEQWMLAITKYADRLLKDLDTVDYLEKIKTQQRNWIGKSEGAEIDFLLDFKKNPADNDHRGPNGERAQLTVFTTRPDTLFGATYLVLAPEHLWVTLATDDDHDVLSNKAEVKKYVAAVKKRTDIERTALGKEKTGVELKGVKAVNPATKEEIPIFVADYVLGKYGTGAIMAVPAHDERDFEFAKKYGITAQPEIPSVINPKNPPVPGKPTVSRNTVHAIVYDPKKDKYLGLKWKKNGWMTFVIGGIEDGEDAVSAARREVLEETGYEKLKFIRTLGGPIRAEYFVSHKDENRISFTTGVLFELQDDKRNKVAAEESEKHEIVWIGNDSLTPDIFPDVEAPFWFSRLKQNEETSNGLSVKDVASLPAIIPGQPWQYGMPQLQEDVRLKQNIETSDGFSIKQVIEPVYLQTTEPGKIVENLPFEHRDAIIAIVKHWSEEKYIGLKWKKVAWGTLITGGIEKGQTPEEAARAEIKEETGFLTPKFVADLGMIHGKFYHVPKKVNRFAHACALYFELQNGSRENISKEEQDTHEILWFTKEELEKFLTPTTHQHVLRVLAGTQGAYEGEGILINSGEFSGMDSETAKKKITEFVGGKMKTTYKLRDWVFSRQRYWGEPIPMVYCEKCAEVKQKALILHGFEGSPERNWFPWMKRELEVRGFEVIAPELPDPDHPKMDAWMKTIAPILKNFGPNDIVIGHSLGSKAAVHAIDKAGKKIKHAYLVASTIGQVEKRDWDALLKKWPDSDMAALRKFWNVKTNFSRVTALTGGVTIITSDDDSNIPLKTHENLPEAWDFQIWNGFKHFTAEVIPELLTEILKSKNTGWQPLPEKDLPLKLPNVKNYKPTDTGESPLAGIASWVKTKCPVCKGPARRETDVMPNWAGSSWYFLRYIDPHNKKSLADKKKLKYWMPVDWYNGGMEHTTLHLLYSRFWNKFLYDIGVVPVSEPYKNRTSHGLILAEGGVKMSKSKGNVVNPDSIVAAYGADTLRVYEMFMGPFDQAIAWDEKSIIGSRKFLEKIWKLAEKLSTKNYKLSTKNFEILLHQTIKKVSEDIEEMKFNTAISAMMIFVNEMEKSESIVQKDFEIFLRILAPFAPHMAEELWSSLGHKKSIHLEPWPKWDEKKLTLDTMKIAVQVNGKIRATIEVSSDTSEEEVKQNALRTSDVQRWLEGKEPKKIIYVKNKLLSVVV